MSLRDQLLSINNKPYDPIFSGKLNVNIEFNKVKENLKVRPKTSPLAFAKSSTLTSRATTSLNNNNNYKQKQSISTINLNKNRKESTLTRKTNTSLNGINGVIDENKNILGIYQEFQNDDDNDSYTNISLLTLNSDETLPPKKTYGNFQYFSYFERYMNRRSPVKIPSYLLPKVPEHLENVPEPTIYELLDPEEQNKLYQMFDIYESVPFRIRSKSIGSERPRKRIVETKVTRASSIECFSLEFLEKKLSPNNNSALSEINYYSVNDNDRQWKMRLRIHEDNRLSPEFHARDIKCPKIYQIDDLIKKHIDKKMNQQANKLGIKNYDVDKELSNMDHLKKPYYYVESKLAPYLELNRKPVINTSYTNTTRSKTAINSHYITATPYVYYKPKIEHETVNEEKKRRQASFLKFSKSLDTKIREDLRINRGPIYFAQLNQENLDTFNDGKSVRLFDKFLYLYEWLEKIDVNECKHFYQNPFKLDKTSNTDKTVNYENFLNEPKGKENEKKETFLQGQRAKIDPFNNPKADTINNKFPVRHNIDLTGKTRYYETVEKQTLAITNDYKSFLHLDNHDINNVNKLKPINTSFSNLTNKSGKSTIPTTANNDKFSLTKEKLKRQKTLNDITLTRVELDLFIL